MVALILLVFLSAVGGTLLILLVGRIGIFVFDHFHIGVHLDQETAGDAQAGQRPSRGPEKEDERDERRREVMELIQKVVHSSLVDRPDTLSMFLQETREAEEGHVRYLLADRPNPDLLVKA
jgi:hypothetical protein